MNGTVTIALQFVPQRLRDGHIQDRWRATLTGPRRVESCGLTRQEALTNLGGQLDLDPTAGWAAPDPVAVLKPWDGLPAVAAVETGAPPASVEVGGAGTG